MPEGGGETGPPFQLELGRRTFIPSEVTCTGRCIPYRTRCQPAEQARDMGDGRTSHPSSANGCTPPHPSPAASGGHGCGFSLPGSFRWSPALGKGPTSGWGLLLARRQEEEGTPWPRPLTQGPLHLGELSMAPPASPDGEENCTFL